ncbi:hypothetical protein BGZ74_010635 [Mortierella antarctica]|nr:hypothetical protein BGZ74_010635 [Mortierella antarctica]
MSLFGKKAGKFFGNVMKELSHPGQQRQQHALQQEQQQQQQLHEPQLQGNQAGGQDFFQQPFFAPPLEGQQQQDQENNNLANNNGDFSHHAPPLDQSNNGGLDILKLPDQFNNTIPDFSMVGYREGHVRIPSVPTRIVLEPSASTEDDTARIQAALDQVAQLPLEDVGPHGAAVRGAVLLRAGVYRVAGALILNASGVVLRGEGQDENGTIVVATGVIQRDFILVNGQLTSDMGSIEMQQAKARTKEMMPSNWYRGSKKTTTTRSGVYIPVGENRIPVEDIERPGTEEWIHDIGMDQLPPRPNSQDSVQWSPQTFTLRFERTIVEIDPALNILVLDIPLVMSLDPKYGPANIFELVHKFPMITDVGIENLRLLSESDPANDEDENHGWYAVVLDNVAHAWVADVTTMHFVSGIYAATWSRFVTVQDCSVLYPVSKPKEGPNVFVDSEGENANNDTGPHERWAMGTLYDNITCNTINVCQRSWKGSGHGWAGAYQVVYNCTAKRNNSCFQNAPGATNWIIGFKGGRTEPEFEGQMTKIMAVASTVEPRSLYWTQLVNRVGDEQYVEENVGASSKMQYPPRI